MKTPNTQNHQSGFSLIEVLFSMLVLGIVIMVGANFTQFQSKPFQRERAQCRAHLLSIMDDLRRRGNVTDIRNFVPMHDGTTTYNDSSRVAPDPTNFTGGTPTTQPPTKDMDGIQSSHRWPTTTNFPVTKLKPNRDGQPVQLHSAILIDSAINTLLSIYNSNVASFCTAADGGIYASTDTRFFPQAPTGNPSLRNAQTFMKIQPVLRSNESLLNPSCPSPLAISPRGIPSGTSAGTVAKHGAIPIVKPAVSNNGVNISTENLSLKVTLKTTYTSQDGQIADCSLSSSFSYVDDINAPTPPNKHEILENDSLLNGNPHPNCSQNSTNRLRANDLVKVRIVIGDQDKPFNERGTQFLCMDESKMIVPDNGYRYRDPISGMATYNTPEYSTINGLPIYFQPPLGVTSPALSISVSERSLDSPATWQPCDHVTLCGKKPTTNSYMLLGAGGNLFLDKLLYLEYEIPRGCRIYMRAIAVDTAGNVSPESVELGSSNYVPSVMAPFGNSMSFANFTPLRSYDNTSTPPEWNCTSTPSVPTTTLPPTTTTTVVPPFGGGVGGCFPAGTKVTLANGQQMPIELIKVGDRVLSYDEISGKNISTTVHQVLHYDPQPQHLYTFYFEDGTQLVSNDIHPLYLANEARYFKAKQIYAKHLTGDNLELLSSNGETKKVISIDLQSKNIPVYNLEVSGSTAYTNETTFWGVGHNYYAEGTLVHNALHFLVPWMPRTTLGSQFDRCNGNFSSGRYMCPKQ